MPPAQAPAPPYRGRCLCGGIRYTLTRWPRRVIQCYCSDCQKSGGSDYQIVRYARPRQALWSSSSLTAPQMAEYRTEDVVVEDPLSNWKIYTIKDGTRSGQPKEKHFCGNCGCVLWTVAMRDGGHLRLVRTSLVDDG